jgi:hypothetical protein
MNVAISTKTRIPPGHAAVLFAYDAEALRLVRLVPGRRWDAERRRWTVPVECVDTAVGVFSRAGHVVEVDGEVRATGLNPFVLLRDALSPILWWRVFRSLDADLDPDRGGDAGMYHLLRKAKERPTGRSDGDHYAGRLGSQH